MKIVNPIYGHILNLLCVLNFFFMSPFFHHHHDEEATEYEIKVHAHLTDVEAVDYADFNHHLEDNDKHEHFFKSNQVDVLRPGRDLQIIYASGFICSSLSESVITEDSESFFTHAESLASRLTRERYVLTASNSSPPKA